MAIAERELAASAHTQFYMEEEYLEREDAAEERSEYVNGELQPMSGGTDDHAFISGNVSSTLRAVLRGRDCRVYSSDMKIYADGAMRYPDVSIVQGPRIYYGGNRTVVSNPLLIAEVLSPSTEKKGQGRKVSQLHSCSIPASLSAGQSNRAACGDVPAWRRWALGLFRSAWLEYGAAHFVAVCISGSKRDL